MNKNLLLMFLSTKSTLLSIIPFRLKFTSIEIKAERVGSGGGIKNEKKSNNKNCYEGKSLEFSFFSLPARFSNHKIRKKEKRKKCIKMPPKECRNRRKKMREEKEKIAFSIEKYNNFLFQFLSSLSSTFIGNNWMNFLAFFFSPTLVGQFLLLLFPSHYLGHFTDNARNFLPFHSIKNNFM